MPFYFHPDIKTYNFQSSFLKTGIFNIYNYLEKEKEKLPLKEEFVYFPLAYFFLGSYQAVISPILGSEFYQWLNDASVQSVDKIGVYRFLFLLKFPYLILDILIAFLLLRLFKEEEIQKKLFTFWLFNPFSFILVYLYSNLDIFAVFLIVLSLFYANKNNSILSAICLGLGAGFKAFPLLLSPYLMLNFSKKWQKLVALLLPTSVFILIILPFLNSPSFQSAALTSGLITRIVSYGINIGFGEILVPSLIFLSILFFYGFFRERIELWKLYLVSFLIILTFIHYHIQWLLWLMPFLSIYYALGDKKDAVLTYTFLIIGFTIPLMYADKFMTFGLLSSVHQVFASLPTLATAVSKVYKVEVIQSILQSVFIGIGVIITYRLLKTNKV